MTDEEIRIALAKSLCFRGYPMAQASQAVKLLHYLIGLTHEPDGFVTKSLRQAASQLDTGVHQMRAAYSLLLHLGWLEKRAARPTAPTAFRVTERLVAEMAAIDLSASERIAGILSGSARAQKSPASEAVPPSAFQYLAEITGEYLHEKLCTLNRYRRDRYLPTYNKRSLKNIDRVLYWFIEAARRGSGKPVVTSLRQLAQATGLVYATAKTARDHLLGWQVIAQHGDVYQLSVPRLAKILSEEEMLPEPDKSENVVSSNPE